MFKHLHCNKCFRKNPIAEVQYWLTECGHVLCQGCLDHASRAHGDSCRAYTNDIQRDTDARHHQGPASTSDKVCAICKESCECIKVTENVEDLPARIQPFFRSCQDLCFDTMDAWKFQEDNMSGLIDYLQGKTIRQHEVLVRARTELRSMKSEVRDLKAEVQRLKKELEGRNVPPTAFRAEPDKAHENKQLSTQSRKVDRHVDANKSTARKSSKRDEQPHHITDDSGGASGERLRSTTSNDFSMRSNRAATARVPPRPARLSLVTTNSSPKWALTGEIFRSPGLSACSRLSLQRQSQQALGHTEDSTRQHPTVSLASMQGVHVLAPSNAQLPTPPFGYNYQPSAIPGAALPNLYHQQPSYLQPPVPAQAPYPSGRLQSRAQQAVPTLGQLAPQYSTSRSSNVVAQGQFIRPGNPSSATRTTWQQQQQQQQLQQQQEILRQFTQQQYQFQGQMPQYPIPQLMMQMPRTAPGVVPSTLIRPTMQGRS